jgi:hypothetical protein
MQRGESSQVAGTSFYRILIYGLHFVYFYLYVVSVNTIFKMFVDI